MHSCRWRPGAELPLRQSRRARRLSTGVVELVRNHPRIADAEQSGCKTEQDLLRICTSAVDIETSYLDLSNGRFGPD